MKGLHPVSATASSTTSFMYVVFYSILWFFLILFDLWATFFGLFLFFCKRTCSVLTVTHLSHRLPPWPASRDWFVLRFEDDCVVVKDLAIIDQVRIMQTYLNWNALVTSTVCAILFMQDSLLKHNLLPCVGHRPSSSAIDIICAKRPIFDRLNIVCPFLFRLSFSLSCLLLMPPSFQILCGARTATLSSPSSTPLAPAHFSSHLNQQLWSHKITSV